MNVCFSIEIFTSPFDPLSNLYRDNESRKLDISFGVEQTVTLAPVPSADEIILLYKTGELSAELARYHQTGDEDENLFLQLCVALHNSGDIDLLSLTRQSAFAKLGGHSFFTAQQLYCDAIPKLDCSVAALMECCRSLVGKAGNDLMANQPNRAFRTWCQRNPNKGASVIEAGKAGDELAKQFVTFALQAANDVAGAIGFIKAYTDERRLSGMMALAGMVFDDALSAHKAIEVLEPFVAVGSSDNVRVNALLATFSVLKQTNDATAAHRLIESAAQEPGPETLYGLAQIVWLYHPLLESVSLQKALIALEAVDPEHLGTVREIDMGLRQLLGTKDEPLVLDFLSAKLRESKLKIENFDSVAHELTNGDKERLYGLIVRWFLSGSFALCDNVRDFVGLDNEGAFDTTAEPLDLSSVQQIFLCRKAIGFLFTSPVICCSIIVSVLRAGNHEAEGVVTDLLFDPILLNYGGNARDYLKNIPSTDHAYSAVQRALANVEKYYDDLEATGTIKELHPSEYQRDVIRHRMQDEMRTVHKLAESKSIFANLVHRSTILYGTRSLTYVKEPDGGQRAVEMDLHPFSTSFELPRREILDPAGLDYMLRVFRAEKLK